jgi:SAM-dependent MidA family methyltransferase
MVTTELEKKLIDRIKADGPITFRDFMEAALFDPSLGYYNTARQKIGSEGDFYTSSNVHPAFGSILAKLFSELREVSFADPFTIVELGAGTGQLAADILSAIRDEYSSLLPRIQYLLVDTSPAMRELQRGKLAEFSSETRFCKLEELENVRGIIFSNELFDALPVHRMVLANGKLNELFVTVSESGSGFSFMPSQASTSRLEEYLRRMNARLREGQAIEINLDAIDLLARVAKVLKEGFLITIDYGDEASKLWSPDRRAGTIRSFYRHQLVDSPLLRVGDQDITASVNFSALVEYGADLGFEKVSYERQTAFLMRMGLIEKIAAQFRSDGSLDNLAERLAVKNLFVPGGISDSFRVLIQRKTIT